MDVDRLRIERAGHRPPLAVLLAVAATVGSIGCSLIGPTTATSFLNQIERSPDPNERFKAYQNLASPRCYDDPAQKARAVQALVKALDSKTEPLATKAVICRTLGALGDPAARDPMIRLVRDPDPLLRVEACRALGIVGKAEDATVLMQIMTLDSNADCQIAAIEALGTLKNNDPRTTTYLVQAMENDDPAIRLAALQALRKITGKDLGVKPGPWRELVVGREVAPQAKGKPAEPGTKDASAAPASTFPRMFRR